MFKCGNVVIQVDMQKKLISEYNQVSIIISIFGPIKTNLNPSENISKV